MSEAGKYRQIAAAIVAVLALLGIGIAITVSDDNNDGKPDRVVVTVNTQAGDGQPTDTVSVPTSVVEQARDELDHKNLEETPADAQPPTDAQIKQGAAVQTTVKPLSEAGAVVGFKGCATRILPANYSSRNGARAVWQVMHYTVSSNRPGWSDVNAIVALFSNPARQASSNFVIDAEGNCAYIVPIEAKAWTQAGGNPWSVSYEVVATGSEGDYLAPAGYAKLKSVVQQVSRRTGIPLRRGAVSSSCTPVSAGIVQHKDFGLCGGGHVDITPFSIDAVVRRLTGPTSVLTTKERKIVAHTRKPRGSGHSRRYWCGRLTAQIAWLGRSHKQPRRGRRLAIERRVRRGSCT